MDDLLDLFGDRKDISEEKDADKNAPVELMTQFLVLVSDRKMQEALSLTSEILQYEPRNEMIIEYRRSLSIYIQQERGKFQDNHCHYSMNVRFAKKKIGFLTLLLFTCFKMRGKRRNLLRQRKNLQMVVMTTMTMRMIQRIQTMTASPNTK